MSLWLIGSSSRLSGLPQSFNLLPTSSSYPTAHSGSISCSRRSAVEGIWRLSASSTVLVVEPGL
uniref:AlNc14C198G8621 protein n=1 Tax=Albugo laibachii Nc14 TaxID=890382 RepID=F0WQF1_9STRA|nr:AlNc14C198G8621 [Albugo laibachii Nc14]|eukprot:CCA23559.1 AlNc14C198G8621 [Albugo laibachii Nc14]